MRRATSANLTSLFLGGKKNPDSSNHLETKHLPSQDDFPNPPTSAKSPGSL